MFSIDSMCWYFTEDDSKMCLYRQHVLGSQARFLLNPTNGTILMCSGLGKKLGKSMGLVAKEVKALTQAQILEFQKTGEGTFAGHKLGLQDIKVKTDSPCEFL